VLRVEIGPGPSKLAQDWTTVSSVPGDAVDLLAEWGMDPLPFLDGTVDEIYASHVIEHVPWFLAPCALVDAWRVLRRGGRIELHTIDFCAVATAYGSGDASDPGDPVFADFMGSINFRIFARPVHYRDGADAMLHRSCYDERYLRMLLGGAGFVDVSRVAEPRGPEKHGRWNLGVSAVKA